MIWASPSQKGSTKRQRHWLDGLWKDWRGCFGPNHVETLSSVNNLGSVYGSQGHYEEADAILCFAGLRLRLEKALRPNHSFTSIFVENLVQVLGKQAKYEEAEAIRLRTRQSPS